MTAPQRSIFGEWPLSETYKVGNVVKVAHPQPTEWKIDKIVKEEVRQRAQSDVRGNVQSIATLKVLCHQVTTRRRFLEKAIDIFEKRTDAMMRIYYQIPWTDTFGASPGERAAQAASIKPSELVALQTLSKDPHTSKFTPRLLGFDESKQQAGAIVPGGFVVTIVWEVVPGLRLGDHLGSGGFWSIESRDERNLVRACFQQTLMKITNAGILPTPGTALNLVWHKESKTLYWVRFRQFIPCEPITWDEHHWLAMFELVECPPNQNPLDPNWNGDTSEWKW